MEQMSAYRQLTPDDFTIYCGEDSVLLPMLSLGARGIISVASHFIGNQLQNLIASFEQQNIREARDLHYRYFDVCRNLFITTNPMPVKYAMSRMGFAVGGCRLPMTWVNDEQAAIIDETLKKVGLL